ncbi:hypothetical protein RQP46_003609 [Phenoliferia psychrophenolica]
MGATIYSLAPELLYHILVLVRGPGVTYKYDDMTPSNKDLLAAALVCREWADVAQRVLWNDAWVTRLWIHFKETDGRYWPVATNVDPDLATVWTEALLKNAPQLSSLYTSTQKRNLGLKHLDIQQGGMVPDPIDVITPFPFQLDHLGIWITPWDPISHLRPLFSSSCDTLQSIRLNIGCSARLKESRLLGEGLQLITSHVERLDLDFREIYDEIDSNTPAHISDYLKLDSFSKLKHLGVTREDQLDPNLFPEDILSNVAVLTNSTLVAECGKPITEAQISAELAQIGPNEFFGTLSAEFMELVKTCDGRGA